MMTTELAAIPSNALPFEAFKAHLRVADGFDAIPGQANRMEGALRAAISALEARLGKIFIARDFILRTQSWSAPDQLGLTLAPVSAVHSVKIARAGGDEVVLDPATYFLREDTHRPILVARSGAFPILTMDAVGEIWLTAGYGTDWSDLPPALAQATLMLAEAYFESNRENPVSLYELPFAVCVLVEPFRDMRLRSFGVVT